MYPLILPAVSKNIIDKGRKSICVTVSLRTYMYSQLIYLHFGGSYTSFTQLDRVGKKPAFIRIVQAAGFYRLLPAFTGCYWL